MGFEPLTWAKILPLGMMFFCILFNYTILRDTKDVLVVTAPGSGAEIIPFLKTYVNLPMAIGFTVLYAKVRTFPEWTSLSRCVFFLTRSEDACYSRRGYHTLLLGGSLSLGSYLPNLVLSTPRAPEFPHAHTLCPQLWVLRPAARPTERALTLPRARLPPRSWPTS